MLQRLLRRFVSGRDGSVMLETALMITILLVLMFGIVDLGRALFTANNLVSAAREGARFGAVQSDISDTLPVKQVVIDHFSPFGGPALTRANVVTTPEPPGGPYTSIRVRVNYRFTWITPIRRFVGAMTDSLHAQAEYNWENR